MSLKRVEVVESFQIKIGNEAVSNSKYEKLLEVKEDHEFNFNEHVSSLCKKTSQKLNALSGITSWVTFDQRRFILNSFIKSHFSYCVIVCMFHSRKLNERINHIHEMALRIVYKDFKLLFQELLIENNSLNTHHRNLQKLVTEIFKVKKWLITWANKWCFRIYRKTILPANNIIFEVKEDPYNKICTTKYGIETSSHQGPNYGTLFQMNIKLSNHLQILRQNKNLDPRELT